MNPIDQGAFMIALEVFQVAAGRFGAR